MKKAIIAAAAFLISAVCAASAAELDAAVENGAMTIARTDAMSDTLVAAFYDNAGSLTYASRMTAEDGIFTISLPSEYSEAKVFDIGNETYTVVFTDDISSTEAPDTTEPPEATDAPEVTSAPTSAGKYLNPSYPEEIDQVLAPAVVKKVLNASGDGVDRYVISALMRGVETEIPVDIDKTIKSAPAAYMGLVGKDASALKKGDVIYVLTNIKGDEVRSIDLLYRPIDPFSYSGSFASLYTGGSTGQKAVYGSKLPSENAYVLGIITDKANNTLTLYPITGEAKNAFEIGFTKDTVTYIYDTNSKDDPYIASSSDIPRSIIPKRAYNDNDDITFLPEYEYNVAFVRIADRDAVDIVVYEFAEE